MRRLFRVSVIMMAVILTACGGETTNPPTPESAVTLVAGEDGRTLDDLIEEATSPLGPDPTPTLDESLIVPPTPDPIPDGSFDRLWVARSGGRNQPDYQIEIFADGRLIVNGQEGQLPAHEIAWLQTQFDEIRVYGIMSNTQLWESRPDIFRYEFEVQLGDYSTYLEGENPYIPQAIRNIIVQVIDYSGYVR